MQLYYLRTLLKASSKTPKPLAFCLLLPFKQVPCLALSFHYHRLFDSNLMNLSQFSLNHNRKFLKMYRTSTLYNLVCPQLFLILVSVSYIKYTRYNEVIVAIFEGLCHMVLGAVLGLLVRFTDKFRKKVKVS